jgi:hypothetical protein
VLAPLMSAGNAVRSLIGTGRLTLSFYKVLTYWRMSARFCDGARNGRNCRPADGRSNAATRDGGNIGESERLANWRRPARTLIAAISLHPDFFLFFSCLPAGRIE